LTATAHTGFARYTYPKSGDRHVLVDLAHVLPTGNGAGVGQQFVSGSISVNNDTSAAPSSTNPSYTGYAEYNGGFNRGPTWRIYFCGTFSQAFDQSKSGVFKYPYDPYQRSAVPHTTIIPLNKSNQVSAPPNSNIAVGGLFTWTSGSIIESRIGISFISAEKACGFIADESPADQTFDQTVEKAKALWNGKCRRRYIAKFVTNSFHRKRP
jgi:putative alpha-1,2-mannosidase